MLDVASFALQVTAGRRGPVVVDLGIGTGALSECCVRRIPAAKIIGIDADAGMLAAARARLGRSLKATVHANFEDAEIPPCDAVVAALALHHVPTAARRLRLFRRIARALRPGGVLISADCHPAAHRRLVAADRADWVRHLEASYLPAVARRYLQAWAREDHYVPLAEELALLRRAGFSADVPGRRGTFAVIVAAAAKPVSQSSSSRDFRV